MHSTSALSGLSLALIGPALSAAQSPLYRFAGDVATDDFSHSVGFCGDVDGDGFGDLVIGATQLDIPAGWVPRGPGFVRVFSGKDGALLHVLRGDALGDSTGLAVDGVPDVDGDGLADIVVGLPNHDGGGSDAGAARVYSGASGAVRFTRFGLAANDWFGKSAEDAGDVDGDGVPDPVVGAPAGARRLVRDSRLARVRIRGAARARWSVARSSGSCDRRM